MAIIVLLQHELCKDVSHNYIVHLFAERWRNCGHRVLEHFGTEPPPPGNLAVLHIDLTVVPAEYRALVSHYEHVINGTVLDISKRTFSQNLVGPGSDWNGPVVVKTDANHYGRMEWIAHSVAEKLGVPSKPPTGPWMKDYLIYDSLREAPDWVWQGPGLIVEKFLPERDAQGYYMRVWTFFGDRERSSRFRAEVPIIKSDLVLGRESVSVPDEIRAWREKLGFAFGKFDYVIHEGHPILLDTNRTPAAPTNSAVTPNSTESYASMADAIHGFLHRPVLRA